ncbi:sensor histidine kinase [Aliidiomarina celeris]|uniref:sensor histidine kinase n=1 Tax=Aliidiomarina celeris TaxID=2249428 RepID=UPI000DEB9E82|nr:histidine kinase [Aliidiomarina celeris]
MHSRYYPLYQLVGWLLLYSSLMLSLRTAFGFTPLEYIFGGVLVASAGIFSHGMRCGYRKWNKDQAVVWQFLYFLLAALVGGAFAACMLFALVLSFAYMGIIDPIATGQTQEVFHAVFWANGTNMALALMLWSGIYLTLVKARQLRLAKEALASSQLQVLEQQLSPHFLFNMINNIRALILEDPHRARESLARLADMLRYSLQPAEGAQVTVAHELNIVSEYIELCKIQFEERLQFESEAPEHLKQALIPRMVLQLCVENAIKHGISQCREGGSISVRLREVEGFLLYIRVENPAPTAQPDAPSSGKNEKVGLKNIRDRLALLYKDKAHKHDKALVNVMLTRHKYTAEYDTVVTEITLPLVFLDD